MVGRVRCEDETLTYKSLIFPLVDPNGVILIYNSFPDGWSGRIDFAGKYLELAGPRGCLGSGKGREIDVLGKSKSRKEEWHGRTSGKKSHIR